MVRSHRFQTGRPRAAFLKVSMEEARSTDAGKELPTDGAAYAKQASAATPHIKFLAQKETSICPLTLV